MKATDDPLVQAQLLIAEMKQDFASDVDALLTEIRGFCDALESGVGTVTRAELLDQLRSFVLEKFDQRLSGSMRTKCRDRHTSDQLEGIGDAIRPLQIRNVDEGDS